MTTHTPEALVEMMTDAQRGAMGGGDCGLDVVRDLTRMGVTTAEGAWTPYGQRVRAAAASWWRMEAKRRESVAEVVAWLLDLPHDQHDADVVKAWDARPASAAGDDLLDWLRNRVAADYERQQEDEGQARAEADAAHGFSGPRRLDGDAFGRAWS